MNSAIVLNISPKNSAKPNTCALRYRIGKRSINRMLKPRLPQDVYILEAQKEYNSDSQLKLKYICKFICKP